MSALERRAIGNVEVGSAIGVDELESRFETAILPSRCLVEALPSIVLNDEEIGELHHGRRIGREASRLEPPNWPAQPAEDEVAGIDAAGRVVTILQATPNGKFRPLRNFPRSD